MMTLITVLDMTKMRNGLEGRLANGLEAENILLDCIVNI